MISRPFCDLLVDQGRSIGLHPIGYKCFSDADWEAPNGMLICSRCREILSTNPFRITFPQRSDYQQSKIETLLAGLKELPK